MSDMSDDFLDLAEPEFETPPVFADQDERRMHVRAYNYWAGLLRGREFPSVSDLEPENLDDFGPHSVLLDFTRDKENPRVRFIGKALREECGLTVSDVLLDQIPSRSLVSRLTDHFFEIIANRAPIGFEAEFVSQRGNNTMYRGILMPLSSDGRAIDYIYGVINWKELADPEFEAQLALESSELPDFNVPAVALEDEVTEVDEVAELAADAGLADRLAAARANAEAVKSADQRSRAALYRALGDAYDFHLAAEADAEAYSEILEDAGIKAQARAPMTPVAKLVFGTDYDKARLTEFAAALSYAARQQVEAGGFTNFVNQADGGLKGLVQAERNARRAETQAPKVDKAAAARDRLRTAAAVGSVSLAAGDEEFVLLVARRNDVGGVDVLEAVPHAQGLLDGALRKLGAPES
jgi:hypothetical protein